MLQKDIPYQKISLVIFTCTGREHLLKSTIDSFNDMVDIKFDQTILAIDGPVNNNIIDYIKPDLIIQQYYRKGYVHSISKALKTISNPYFFWLEDDWNFTKKLALNKLYHQLQAHKQWSQIIYSKFGPLNAEQKSIHLEDNLYQTDFGFSANPCMCKTDLLTTVFDSMINAPKGDKLGEDGFENYITKQFEQAGLISVIVDPIDHIPISHEGYLESTPRNWHMTNSLVEKTKSHLLTIPKPSVARRFIMFIKLIVTLVSLSVKQFFSKKAYEFCFRIIASSKNIYKNN